MDNAILTSDGDERRQFMHEDEKETRQAFLGTSLGGLISLRPLEAATPQRRPPRPTWRTTRGAHATLQVPTLEVVSA